MAAIGALREAIRVRLETIAGLRTYATWPDSLNPPAAIVVPRRQTSKLTLAGTYKHHTFEITVAVPAGTLRTAQDALDAYWSDTGDSSIEAAVLGDDTLDGLALGIVRFDGTGYGQEINIGEGANAITYLGCTFEMEFMTDG